MKRILVVAAFWQRRGRIFLAKRPHNKARGGLWEFPGGKVEKGETPEEALARELREELGLEVQVGQRLAALDYDYPDVAINLVCHQISALGNPLPQEGQEGGWFLPKELETLELAPADRLLWQRLKETLEKAQG